MQTLLTWEALSGILRHILTFAGGWLVTKGYFDSGTLQQVIGAILVIGGVIFSVVSKSVTVAQPTPLFKPPS